MTTKKIVLLIMVFLFGSSFGCIVNSSNDEILGYLNLNKSQLIEKLGNDYETVTTGPEGIYEGYYYSNIGITIDFDDLGKVATIYCDKKVNIKNARAGMNFEQIQKALGKTKMHKIFDEESNSTVYQVWYFIGKNCKLIFESDKGDGSNSSLTILRIGATYYAPDQSK